MIYEIRTYQVVIGGVTEVEERTAAAMDAWGPARPLVGFFHTEAGLLNEVVHVWRFENLEERAQVRAAALEHPLWPPDTGHLILNQQIEIVAPWPFVPPWEPGVRGPLYELRQYTFVPGSLPEVRGGWERALPGRMRFSQPALAGNVEIGPSVNSFIHIWPYPNLEARTVAQRESRMDGTWPPPIRRHLLRMTSKLLLPAAFSPAQ